MTEQSIRFSVSNQRDLRSATWKLFSPKGKEDFYLACRELRGAIKVSFHQSGRWHVGFDETFLEKEAPEDSPLLDNRYLSKWPEPQELCPGVRLAFRIFVPEAAITVLKKEEEKSLIWIPSPSQGKAIEILIILTLPETKISTWPGAKSMGTSLVGKIDLDSGKKVWAVYRVMELPSLKHLENGKSTFFGNSSQKDLKGPGLRALIPVEFVDGSMGFLDATIEENAKKKE